MIVNSLKDGWEIIYQRSHALLAAQLAAAWEEQYHPARWVETIVAIAQHDDQENFWEGARHLTDIGAPINFTETDINTSRLTAYNVINNARRQGLWTALLISAHNSFLYEPLRGQDSKMDAFLDEQQENQKAWLKELKMSRREFAPHYQLVSWADRLSLILCQRQLPDRERWLDICEGPDGEMHRVMQRMDETIVLDPWRFTETDITFSIEVRRVHQLAFKNDEDYHQALEEAPLETRCWRFKK